MKYLFDTNAVIALLSGHEGILSCVKYYLPGDFGVSSIVMHELYFGAYNSQKIEENLSKLSALKFEVLPFSLFDGKAAGEIRANLKKQGTPIGPYDVLIAGQAISRSLILITNNVKEFKRVEALVYEDWLDPRVVLPPSGYKILG